MFDMEQISFMPRRPGREQLTPKEERIKKLFNALKKELRGDKWEITIRGGPRNFIVEIVR